MTMSSTPYLNRLAIGQVQEAIYQAHCRKGIIPGAEMCRILALARGSIALLEHVARHLFWRAPPRERILLAPLYWRGRRDGSR